MRKLLLLFVALIGMGATAQAQETMYVKYATSWIGNIVWGGWHEATYTESSLYKVSVSYYASIANSGGIYINTTASDNGQTFIPLSDMEIVGNAGFLNLTRATIYIHPTTHKVVVDIDNITTGVEDLNVEQETSGKARKVIENGQVVIIKDGIRYNLNGARID